jgi:hypothetical protein
MDKGTFFTLMQCIRMRHIPDKTHLLQASQGLQLASRFCVLGATDCSLRWLDPADSPMHKIQIKDEMWIEFFFSVQGILRNSVGLSDEEVKSETDPFIGKL